MVATLHKHIGTESALRELGEQRVGNLARGLKQIINQKAYNASRGVPPLIRTDEVPADAIKAPEAISDEQLRAFEKLASKVFIDIYT